MPACMRRVPGCYKSAGTAQRVWQATAIPMSLSGIGSWGSYVYCVNNPLVYWDPTGEATYDKNGNIIDFEGGTEKNYFKDGSGSHLLPSANVLRASADLLNKTRDNNDGLHEYATLVPKGETALNETESGDPYLTVENGDRT